MADPFLLSTQYQDRLDKSTKALEDLPRYVMEGMKIPGIIAQNRILGVQAQEAQDSLTVSQQLKKAVQDPHGIMGEFGDLKTAKEMRQFMAKHAAISVSPIGKNLLGIFDKITTATEEAEQHSIQRIGDLAQAKHLAELQEKFPGLDVRNNPSHRVIAQGNMSLEQLAKEARLEGLRPDGLTKDLLDPETGTIDPSKAMAWHDSLKASQSIISREGIEASKLEAAKVRSSANSILADRRMTIAEKGLQLRELGFGLREAEDAIKAAELGYQIEGGQGLPSNPGGVKLTPIERPATTATTTKLQGQALDGARAISALDDSIKTIQSHPEAFGLRGTIGGVVEKVKGQLNPNDPMDTPISNARQKASIAFADIAKSLRTDSGNMSRYELTKLEQAGSVLDWTESPQIALMKQKNLLAVVLGQQLRNLKARNAPVEDTLLRKIDPSEIIGLGQEGLLTEDELRRWHRLKP